MSIFRFFLPLLVFLYMFTSLPAQLQIPEIPDPAIVPMTFLEQERALVLRKLRYYQIRGDGFILHLGCRDGVFSKEIALYLPQGKLIGLENTFPNNPPSDSLNTTFIEGKFMDQGWKNLYDCIICTQLEEWEQNPKAFYYALKKALKPGGVAIILLCVEDALPMANPLKKKLLNHQVPEEYAEYIRFWLHIDCIKFRDLMRKDSNIEQASVGMRRMITCFKDIEIFKAEAKKWCKRIASLPAPVQEKCLDQLSIEVKKDLLSYEGQEYHYFIYKLEVASFRKKIGTFVPLMQSSG